MIIPGSDRFDDHHRSLFTFWTPGNVFSITLEQTQPHRYNNFWWSRRELHTFPNRSEPGGFIKVLEETITSDLDKSSGEDMFFKSSDKLLLGEGHDLLFVAIVIIFVTEGDGALVNTDNAVMGDCHLVGITTEILNHLQRASERFFRIDIPFFKPDGFEQVIKIVLCNVELLFFVQPPDVLHEITFEDLSHGTHGKYKLIVLPFFLQPSVIFNTPRANDAVQVRMERKILPPGVKNGSEPGFGPKILGIFSQRKQRVCSGIEEDLE